MVEATNLFLHANKIFFRTCTFLETCDLPLVFAIFMNLDFSIYYSIHEKVSFKVVVPKLL
jgi:hypothetical protein